MTALAGMTTVGDQLCHKAEVGNVARRAIRFACCFFMLMIVMAAFVACRRGDCVRHALAPTSTVARVQAAAEGEVNHRGDSCDDADQRSHGRCLYYPLLSIHLPGKLKFEMVTQLFARHENTPAASIGPDLAADRVLDCLAIRTIRTHGRPFIRQDCQARNRHRPSSSRQTARNESRLSSGASAVTAWMRTRPVMRAMPGAGKLHSRSS